MSKIGNKDLARAIMEKFEIDRQAAEQFVATMFDVLSDGLQREKQVKVKGLGTFKVTSVASRKSVDVNTGEPIIIEGRDKINFTADNGLRDQVNRPFAQFETVVVNDGVDFDDIDRRFADSLADMGDGDAAEGEDEPVARPAVHVLAEPQADEQADEPQASVEESVETADAVPAEQVDAPEPVAASLSPLTISPAQMAVLNGDGRSEERVVDEAGGEPVVESMTLSAAQLSVLNGRVEAPVMTESEDCGADGAEATQAEPELEDAEQTDNTPALLLVEQMEHQRRLVKWVVGTAALLVLACLGGLIYFGSQLEKRNHRIAHLEAEAALVKHRQPTVGQVAPQQQPVSRPQAPADSVTGGKAAVKEIPAESDKALKEKAREEAAARKAAETEREAARQAELAREQAAREKAEQQKAEQQREQAAQYNKDVRIRTGAYTIVGIDHTVTVRAGQTLAGISKASLGPGMECYIEAVNGGRTTFKAGEKVKIPKLKLKKK